MAGYGLSAKDIAIVLGIDAWVLERDYWTELQAGAIKANAKVAESLFHRATGEGREGVVAAIFWLKTRAVGQLVSFRRSCLGVALFPSPAPCYFLPRWQIPYRNGFSGDREGGKS